MTETNPDVRERVERFSLLRAAQRALARCMHPAAVDPLREEGRHILVQLQAASRDESEIQNEVTIREVDRLLSHHLGQTLELLGKLEFAQLRAAGADLCRDNPDELRALVDLILLGSLSDDQEIRLVEYLVTMLSGEDQDGRRALVRDPSELTDALREVGARKAADVSIEAGEAVARLEMATSSLIRGGDHHELRNEIRGFKQELGARILHPEILRAAVSYNVAMANQVSARMDSTLGLDELADDLLSELKQSEAGDSDLLHGRGMTRLAAALRARIRGGPGDDGTASRIVAAFKLDGLVAREVEALEDPDGDGLNPLIVSAVVLGCVLRQRKTLTDRLAEIGLDPEVLERDALPALLREMGAASSKFFADNSHSEAFVISEVKTRNLAAIHASAERRARAGGEGVARSAGARTGWQLPFGISFGMLGMIAGPILGLAVGVMLFTSSGNEVRILSPSELSEISPFLDSGHQRVEGGELRFVGHLYPTWDYLATAERQSAAAEVAGHFVARGIRDGVLLGVGPRLMARWDDGTLIELTPKSSD